MTIEEVLAAHGPAKVIEAINGMSGGWVERCAPLGLHPETLGDGWRWMRAAYEALPPHMQEAFGEEVALDLAELDRDLPL
jgi:hypothetical protein